MFPRLSISIPNARAQLTADVAAFAGEGFFSAIICVAGGWAGGNASSGGAHPLFFS